MEKHLELPSIVEEGLRWCIGDGRTTSIWAGPWIRDGPNRFLQPPSNQDLFPMKVHELMVAGTGVWNQTLIQSLFPPEEASAVLRVPLLSSDRDDKIMWWPSKQGMYTVKFAYHLCMDRFIVEEQYQIEGAWILIWKMKVPPRVKNILWRACRDYVPTRTRLQNKGVVCPISCVLCDSDLENCCHLFLTCSKSIACWEREGLWDNIDPLIIQFDSFREIFFELCSRVNEDQRAVIWMLIWSLWRSRNNQL